MKHADILDNFIAISNRNVNLSMAYLSPRDRVSNILVGQYVEVIVNFYVVFCHTQDIITRDRFSNSAAKTTSIADQRAIEER